jgi:UDP-glucose 4-epimerase
LKILVTGGCGFIGTNLCHVLARDGHEIRVLDDESLGRREFLGDLAVDFRKGSILDRAAVKSALSGMDAVVHLAADTRVMDSIADPAKNFETNAVGSFIVLDEMRQAGVGRIVSASTGGAILGEAPCPVHEDILPRPVAPYGASKLAMEGYHSAFAGAYGLHCACLRFSNVYGPRSFHKGSVVAAFMRQILKGRPLTVYGDGSQVRDYVFVEDLVEGVSRALQAEVSGVYQLGTGRPVTLNALIAAMRETVGREHTFEVRYEPARQGEIHTTYCDISKASKAFGYSTPTSLEAGLSATWRWFLEQQSG